MTLKLYCFGESGNAYKVALALRLAGLEWQPIALDFFHGAARTPDYREVNRMAEVPVLDVGSERISQSGAILDWISEQTGKFDGGRARREVLRWVLFDNHKVSGTAGSLRFLMNFIPEEKRNPDVIAWLSGRFHAALRTLDLQLSDHEWLAGDGPTNADFSCCSYLFYEEPFMFERADWPNIDRWLTDIAALEGWAHPYDLMPRAFPRLEA